MSGTLKSSSQLELSGKLISEGRYKLIHILGQGGYGVVYKALDTTSSEENPKYYAVKCLLRDTSSAREGIEVKHHLELSSVEHILTLHCVIQDDDFIYLVLDLCTGGDLFEVASERRFYPMDDAKTKIAVLQIIDALSACHDAGIFHGDIKLENFLCDADGLNVRLTDFGLSTKETEVIAGGAGTIGYRAPECEVLGTSYSPRAADVWALGILIFSLINGAHLWDKATKDDPRFELFLLNPERLLEDNPMSFGVYEILKKVLVGGEADRIKLPELRIEFENLETFYYPDADMSPHSLHILTFETDDLSSDSFEARPRSTNGAQYGIIIEFPSLISDNNHSAHGDNSLRASDEAGTPAPPIVHPEIALPALHDDRALPPTAKRSSRFKSVVRRVKAVGVVARRRWTGLSLLLK
ncbi:kinase-like protein [Athelia psychrophila]|uniref:Kinase-like protein n=1 Tax=Athelia psychrophila TaxID=1759441 RepID=A0A166E888_9AGAM|nr:kinase-like protein [Fibularhizoctonia sp. CBS 109695]